MSKINIFNDENEMQEWLSSKLESNALADLIENIRDFKDNNYKNDPASLRIRKSFSTCIESLYITEKIFDNEDISTSEGESLKPDFILYAPETESIVVVELKNQKSASRQAGTELNSYTAEIKSAIPLIADGDIVHVIISTVWPTLLIHYIRHQIFWQHKNLICLEPKMDKNNEVFLEIVSSDMIAEDIAQFKVGEQHLGGWHICLYGKNGMNLDEKQHVMKSALGSIATTGNRLNSHGFAFLWEDPLVIRNENIAPYFITIVNFAPYQSLEKFLHTEEPGENLPELIWRFMKFTNEHSPEGHGNTLGEITDSCLDILKTICRPIIEGFHTWDSLKREMERRAEKIAFAGWGVFGDTFFNKLKEAYQNTQMDYEFDSPEIGDEVLEEVIDKNYKHIPLGWLFIDDEWPEFKQDE